MTSRDLLWATIVAECGQEDLTLEPFAHCDLVFFYACVWPTVPPGEIRAALAECLRAKKRGLL